MTGKIFRYAFLVGAVSLVLCAALFFGLQYRRNLDDAYEALRQDAAYVAQGVEQIGAAYLENLSSDKQITWIAADGSVLYNSCGQELGNQGELSEVRAALDTGSGQASRTSELEGVSMLCYALRLTDGTVVRLTLPVSAVRAALMMVSPVLWVFVLVLTLSGLLALRAAKQIVRPINEMDVDHPEQLHTYRELSPLVSKLQEQRLTIDEQIETLHRRQKEFSALTDSMHEGFLLLDMDRVILSANASALELVAGAAQGQPLPESDEITRKAAEQALRGERGEATFSRNGRSWQLVASPVRSRKKTVGAVLLWMDVSEREQREQLRKEFSANVSHELKTPLTSISGFAELMAQGNVPPESVADFSKHIHKEAQRLIALVDDIIKLSKLDENAVQPDWENVELYSLSEEVLDSLRSVAERQNIRLTLEGSPAEVNGVWQLLNEMIYNLCDNAIKYNRPGGYVRVSVTRQDSLVCLSVADNGIGIPEQAQSRVFERFFRVDKSHSKRIGGTGLGLSIVKHGAQYLNAQLSLDSKLNEGTTVTLRFLAAKPTEA